MPVLHMGVLDIPYAKRGGVTTFQIATWLEEKYHIMETFYNLHQNDVVLASIENSLKGALENLALGGPLNDNMYQSAGDKITSSFKLFLSASEIESQGIPGVPTQAALDGVNHRMKNPYGKWVKRGKKKKFVRNPRRPSFIDTGTYQSTSISWVTKS